MPWPPGHTIYHAMPTGHIIHTAKHWQAMQYTMLCLARSYPIPYYARQAIPYAMPCHAHQAIPYTMACPPGYTVYHCQAIPYTMPCPSGHTFSSTMPARPYHIPCHASPAHNKYHAMTTRPYHIPYHVRQVIPYTMSYHGQRLLQWIMSLKQGGERCRYQMHLSPLSPVNLEVVGAPQMTLQQYLSILPCLPLPSGNPPNPFPSIPWCYLPISSSVFLSFLLLSLYTAELSSPCQRILRCAHTIWVSVSLPWLGDHHALQLRSGFWCEPPRSSHGLCRKCLEVSYSISSQGLGSFSRFLLSRSSCHRHKGR